ncbi:Acetyltransferase (GNAT) family protein [Lentzea xinjiangensis]|uniref:Acetyltransferase (GNAT) family protein n=2 Tax=Lentzea xinjiangensis TaxID=402600 RepID=A0A1H9RTY5_9PSEU|nr:Acetyltransferase (GNAT) family protein [Lentzea xinjiangensis]
MSRKFELQPFEADQAAPADLRALYELSVAALRLDRPDPVVLDYDDWVASLRQLAPSLGPRGYWIARCDGELVAKAVVYFPPKENEHLALTEITVAPRRRREGVGTAVLMALLPELEARGRKLVEGWELSKGGPGAQWAVGVGMRISKSTIAQTLDIRDVAPALWEVPAPDGFRVAEWVGAAPDELVASYARALHVMRDAPAGDSEYRLAEWTAERVREAEARHRERNVVQRVVVAVSEATGEVVALTQMDLYTAYPEWAVQQDTAVIPAYRGKGLGRWVKAHMLRALLAERPSIGKIYTNVNADNQHMIRVNGQIGFTTSRSTVGVSGEIAELRRLLG